MRLVGIVLLSIPAALMLGGMGYMIWDLLQHPDRLTAALVLGWILSQSTGKQQ